MQNKAPTVEVDISSDAYTEHLATVNKEHNVSATDDICNTQGQIIVKEGTRIDEQTAERILRFKLLKPIECSVALENEFTASGLMETIETFFRSNPSTALLFEKFNDGPLLQRCCLYACKLPMLRQKITVVSLVMPTIFEQAMFCAWMGMTMVSQNDYKDVKPENIFLAGLCHDVGMVHISAQILDKTEKLTAGEWRQIQAHPVIGYNIVNKTKGMDVIVSRAILEHHENLDGSGYPKGRHFNELCQEGQLLNLLDSVNAIFNKRFKPFNRSLKGIIPIIQINRHSRFSDAGKHLIILLKTLPNDMTPANIPDAIAPKIRDTVKARIDYIAECTRIATSLAADVGVKKEPRQVNSIHNAIVHICMTLTQCGLVNDEYKAWLDSAFETKKPEDYKEVEEAYTMIHELVYHFSRLKRQISVYLEQPGTLSDAEILKKHLTALENVKLPKVEPMLAHMWLFKA